MRREEEALETAREIERLLRSSAELASALVQQTKLRAEDDRLDRLEHENREFEAQLLELEEQNNDLIKLYVASHQIHASLDLSDVLRTVLEVAINLIGAERLAIFLVDESGRELYAVAAEDEDGGALPRIPLGEGAIGGTVSSRSIRHGTGSDAADPLVCIPLWIHERPLGAIAVYRLLSQKQRLTTVDHEIFELLARHAATAIYSARLYSQSKRKLDTIQSFISLLAE